METTLCRALLTTTGFNGDITAMNWNANGSSHSYAFTYDGVNRMLNAIHGTGAYTEKVTEYDKNGNIKFLQRYNSGSLVDNLTYNYGGNQLTKVEDATGNSTGFTNGASTTNEYTYDANGNLTKDSNKGIASITYNSLNLPQVVAFSNGNTITYLYTADGRKLRTVHKIGTATTTTDYCGNVIYENGTQKLLLTEEGYIDLANSNTYYYYLKDHQGNNRVVFNGSGTVMETNHYYPFGGTFASSTNVQPYKYNGKELDSKNGLNWYDYGARHYDAAIGRWYGVDPLAEKYYGTSTYAYCLDNPVLQYDPDGCRVRPSNPVRRGYRNGGRPNPYAFYPRGLQPQSYRKISQVSYKGGSGLYERIALGEQNYVKDVTVGDNTVQMTRGNTTGMKLVGYSGLLNNAKEFSEQLLEMSTETNYYKDGRKSKVTNYVIKDKKLALAQEVYSKKYSALSEQLGNDISLLEKNAIIQEKIGISPLQAIIIDMLMNQSNYVIEENKQIIPEFRQGY